MSGDRHDDDAPARGDDEERQRREEHERELVQDRAYARRLDESEIRGRAIECFDRLVKLGFTAHLIAVQVRGAVEYRLTIYPDGNSAIPADLLQAVARDYNFDFQMERDPFYDGGWAIMFYPLA